MEGFIQSVKIVNNIIVSVFIYFGGNSFTDDGKLHWKTSSPKVIIIL
jgi:hypothetical protein